MGLFAEILPAPVATVLAAVLAGAAAWYGQAWKWRRDAKDEAARILRYYRDPLLRAAFDLQSRLYNIVLRRFLQTYVNGGDAEKRAYALSSTLWLVGQYFGWVEILRREIQFLDLGSEERNRELQRRFGEIAEAFATDAYPAASGFVTYRGEQRAIGEFMVCERGGDGTARLDCLGYSSFAEQLNTALLALEEEKQPSAAAARPPFAAWAIRFQRDLERAARGEVGMIRLVAAQRRLVGLIDHLDSERIRYPDADVRGRLPAPGPDDGRLDRLARFVLPDGPPWKRVDDWAARHGFDLVRSADANGRRAYTWVSRLRFTTADVLIEYRDGGVVDIAGSVRRWPRRPVPIEGSGARRPRNAADALLSEFDRPLLLRPRRGLRRARSRAL